MWNVIAKAVVGTLASSVTASAIGGVKRFSRLNDFHRGQVARETAMAALEESIVYTDCSLLWPFSNIYAGIRAGRKAYLEEVKFSEMIESRRRI